MAMVRVSLFLVTRFLADSISRAFLVQLPPVILWKLRVSQKNFDAIAEQSIRHKLRRIDFLGALFMSVTILSTLFVLDVGGQKYAWTHPILVASGCVALVGAITFYIWERFFAKEPIFPVQLLTRYVVVTSYGILLLQNFAQTAVSVCSEAPMLQSTLNHL
jgi:predicted neutral ceramidase superfamily lipid hydrolase